MPWPGETAYKEAVVLPNATGGGRLKLGRDYWNGSRLPALAFTFERSLTSRISIDNAEPARPAANSGGTRYADLRH
jgi:hypothetical protein